MNMELKADGGLAPLKQRGTELEVTLKCELQRWEVSIKDKNQCWEEP